jgi:glycosyltransferase involved in cell wall biosynthesis
MRIVDANFIFDEKLQTEAEQLKQHYTVVGWAEALQQKGVEVIVVKRFSRETTLEKNSVVYHFIKDEFPGHLKAWQIPLRFLKMVASLRPDVVHLHGLSFSLQTFVLRQLLNKNVAIVVQHHGGPPIKGIRKRLHDLFNSVVDGFFFTTTEQGAQWFKNKKVKVLPVMEGATFFDYENRHSSRSGCHHNREHYSNKTGMKGAPAFLWVGRLDNNKDPLTVLSGFQTLFGRHPEGMLYMVYSDGELLKEVEEKVSNSDALKARVKLLGKIAHEDMEPLYCSADYFVLGSHYEGSGYALTEALSCGCVPIVTDIPSFRMMTNNGQLGALWEAGDQDSFVKAAESALNKPEEKQRKACVEFFEKNLSFDAIAGTALDHYQKLIHHRING